VFLSLRRYIGLVTPVSDSRRLSIHIRRSLGHPDASPVCCPQEGLPRMQFSKSSLIRSPDRQPNGSRRASQLTAGRFSTTCGGPRLVSTKELSKMWDIPESTLRYWRCAGIGPTYVKLGGRIKYDLVDVETYVGANKRKPSVRAHGG
jgi:hypothetical protein